MENVQINEGPDLRLDYMGSFIQKTLKLKPEKWQRLLTFEEQRTIIKDFLDIPTEMVLVIQVTQSAQLLPTTTFPLTQLKTKGVYFAKRLPIEVPRDDCGCWIISGDLATRSIDQLSCLVDEIFVPLLSNTENHRGWPEMVAQDVLKHTHSLKSTVYQVQGQVSGRTILPMPVGVEKCVVTARDLQENAECAVDLYLKSAIEGVVIKWVTQINDVFMETSASAFNNGQNPTPGVGECTLKLINKD